MRPRGLLLVLLVILIEYCGAEPASAERQYGKPRNVNVAFTLSNEIYTEVLTNHSSAEYKALVKKVTDEVVAKVPKFRNKFTVESCFTNGSVIDSDGKADSVRVHARVITNKGNQYKANKFVRNNLKKSGVTGLVPSSVSVGVRLCVAGYQGSSACIAMKQDYPQLNIICVEARDRHECIQWVDERKVDVVRGDVEDIYLAEEMFGEELSVVAETRDKKKKRDPYQNHIVAVVRRSTINGVQSLNGSKLCSTGYGTASGWFVPLSKLLEMGELYCPWSGSVLEKNLGAFSSYFGEACLPGQWGPIPEVSNSYKRGNYSNLCSLCDSPDACMAPAGQDGALQCLSSGGDVAWLDLEAAKEFSTANPEEFGFLCLDGSIEDLNTKKPCSWAGKPWPGWLIRADETEADVIVSTLRKAANKAKNPMKDWAEAVLGITKPSVIIELDPPLSPESYLNQGGYYIILSHPGCDAYPCGTGRKRRQASEGYNVKFCVSSDISLNQCNAFAQVLASRPEARPLLTCVKELDCIKAVANGTADFVPLDGGDVFTAYRDHKLTPVISEVYGAYAASYYAVAVVRADSGITKLADLEGKKSCHTGINKTAGWNMPLKALLDAGLLDEKDKCDYPKQIGGFFNESCAPGANSSKYDPNDTNPTSLCDLCIGNDKNEFVCDRDANELYYGYDGAFRCLVQGGGDVAFVKQTTVPTNTEPACELDWCKDLTSSDYRLLCKDDTTKNVEDYLNCNLAKNPSHMVVTRDSTNDALRKDIRDLLLLAADELPLGNDVFALFGDHDVLFKSSATSLEYLSSAEFGELKKGTYWQALETLEDCD